MSKFINTQFSVSGIKDFSVNTTYSKYDLVDFQYYTGNSSHPENLSGLFAWFNVDTLENTLSDGSGRVSKWYNLAPGHSSQDLVNTDATPTNDSRPIYDSKRNCLSFLASNENSKYNQLYTAANFSGFLTGDRCWFLVYEFDSLRYDYQNVNGTFSNFSTILNTDTGNAIKTSGYLGVYGNNSQGVLNSNVPNGSEEFIGGPDEAVYPSASTINSVFSAAKLLNNKNIISIIKDNTNNTLKIRNNGYELLSLSTLNYFHSGAANLRLGTAVNGHVTNNSLYNYDASNISYYEIIGCSKAPSDQEISGVEKYLFKKHFTNDDNAYIASQDSIVATDYRYAPINITGSQYFTKNIDLLFKKTYGCSASFKSKMIKTTFGDGYFTNVSPGINGLQSDFSLIYDGLTDIQSKALIGFFQNTFEYQAKNPEESYESVAMDLFYPYKNNAYIYFNNLDHSSKEANLNTININCVTAYDSVLDYKGYLITDEEVGRSYNQSSKYIKNDVVFFKTIDNNLEGYYWYTGQDNITLNDSYSPTGNSSLFTKNFYFKPDLDFTIPISPRYIKNEFEMTSPVFQNDGINKTVLAFDFSFTNRSDKEARAILKYLDNKVGFKIFEIALPSPYNKNINVYCPEWSHAYKFNDNHDITIKLLEFKGKLGSDTFFKTFVEL